MPNRRTPDIDEEFEPEAFLQSWPGPRAIRERILAYRTKDAITLLDEAQRIARTIRFDDPIASPIEKQLAEIIAVVANILRSQYSN